MVTKSRRAWRVPVRLLAAIGACIALSGCIVEPLYGPHYYRPRPYYYGGY